MKFLKIGHFNTKINDLKEFDLKWCKHDLNMNLLSYGKKKLFIYRVIKNIKNFKK